MPDPAMIMGDMAVDAVEVRRVAFPVPTELDLSTRDDDIGNHVLKVKLGTRPVPIVLDVRANVDDIVNDVFEGIWVAAPVPAVFIRLIVGFKEVDATADFEGLMRAPPKLLEVVDIGNHRLGFGLDIGPVPILLDFSVDADVMGDEACKIVGFAAPVPAVLIRLGPGIEEVETIADLEGLTVKGPQKPLRLATPEGDDVGITRLVAGFVAFKIVE